VNDRLRAYADDGYAEVTRAIAAGEAELAIEILQFLMVKLDLVTCHHGDKLCNEPTINGTFFCLAHQRTKSATWRRWV
jgi:hypothetical protein